MLDEPDESLLAIVAREDKAIAAAQEIRGQAVAEITRRHREHAEAQLTRDGKSFGTTRYAIPGNEAYFLKGEITRKVSWDSGKLLGIALSMPEADAKATFKFDMSVPEAKYAQATGNFRAALEAARTETLGEFRLSLASTKPTTTTTENAA